MEKQPRLKGVTIVEGRKAKCMQLIKAISKTN